MKRIIYSIAFCTAFISSTNAQQLGQYSQYINNQFLLNPAAAGVEDYLDINMGFRQQWVGFDNAPRNYYISACAPLGMGAPKITSSFNGSAGGESSTSFAGKTKHAVGGYIASDSYGPFKKITGSAAYAYHLPLNNDLHLSFGLNAGVSNMKFDETQVTLLTSNDNTFNTFALGQGRNITYFDANVGTYLYSDKFYVGYSSNQLLQNKIYFGDAPLNGKLNVHHFLTGGYHFEVSDDFKITPSLLVKYMSPAPVSLDFTVKALYQDKYYGGISYRNGDAIIGFLGATINNVVKVAYSFDYTLSKLSDYNSGGHEITLGFMIKS